MCIRDRTSIFNSQNNDLNLDNTIGIPQGRILQSKFIRSSNEKINNLGNSLSLVEPVKINFGGKRFIFKRRKKVTKTIPPVVQEEPIEESMEEPFEEPMEEPEQIEEPSPVINRAPVVQRKAPQSISRPPPQNQPRSRLPPQNQPRSKLPPQNRQPRSKLPPQNRQPRSKLPPQNRQPKASTFRLQKDPNVHPDNFPQTPNLSRRNQRVPSR